MDRSRPEVVPHQAVDEEVDAGVEDGGEVGDVGQTLYPPGREEYQGLLVTGDDCLRSDWSTRSPRLTTCY